MKTITRISILLLLAAGIGCDQSTAGAPSDRKLTLFRPASQAIRQGETSDIAVVIHRENFDGDVRVSFENLPAGVFVTNLRPIAAGKNRAVYTLEATPDAKLVGNRMAAITVEGPGGLKATEFFGVSVRGRKVADR